MFRYHRTWLECAVQDVVDMVDVAAFLVKT